MSCRGLNGGAGEWFGAWLQMQLEEVLLNVSLTNVWPADDARCSCSAYQRSSQLASTGKRSQQPPLAEHFNS
jgi:hypothetical protein